MEKKRNYIIGIGGSEVDCVVISRVCGTEKQVKEHLMKLVMEDRLQDEDCFDMGTDSIDEIEIMDSGEMNAYNCFHDYHIDYTACPEDYTIIKMLWNNVFKGDNDYVVRKN